MAREYVLQGGDGVISVTANVAPAAVAKVIASPPPLYLPHISPTSPPHLPYISPTSPHISRELRLLARDLLLGLAPRLGVGLGLGLG